MSNDAWNPTTYRQFADERRQPFHDLLALVDGADVRDAVDLGCGPGELTRLAAQMLGTTHMVGIDNSPAMLAKSDEHAGPGVTFQLGDIESWTSDHDLDLVLASASLHWVPDHATVMRRWTDALRPGGQIAIQVPANAYMPSHTVADAVAHSDEFRDAFGADGPPVDPVAVNVLAPEQYATLLYDLGYVRQTVRLQVYPHVLASSRSVVDWVRGTTLTRFQSVLDDETFARFVAAYERELIATIGDNEPHFFPFRRILMWARLPS